MRSISRHSKYGGKTHIKKFPKRQYEYSEVKWKGGEREGDPICPLCNRSCPRTGRSDQSPAPTSDPTGVIVEHECSVHGTFDVNWS